MACGLLRPIYFLLGVLGPFTFLGHPWPFLILRPHGLLLTLLAFPDPITLSFIFRAHGLVINLLLSLLVLRVCCGHSYFTTSHTAYGFATSLFLRSFRPVCSSRPICLFYGLGFNSFSIYLLTLFRPCCWASSFYWASQNEH